jgi:lysozyme
MSVLFPRLIELLKTEEGFRARVYDDATGKELRRGDVVKGVPTIGYGTTVLTREQAQWLLASRLATDHEALRKALPWSVELPDVAQEVLLAMAYQLGLDGLLKFQRTLSCLQTRDYHCAADAMLASRWARQTPERVERMAALIRGLADHQARVGREWNASQEPTTSETPTVAPDPFDWQGRTGQ